jgi:hypothetical protein
MTTYTSTSSRVTRPKPAIRRNRDPPIAELPYIREERALNDSLIDRLHQEVEMRTIRLREAEANVEMRGIECGRAELRLETATSIREKLVKTREMFSLSEHLSTRIDAVQSASGHQDDPVSPNLLAIANSLSMGSDFIKDIDSRIEEATLAVRMAQDAVARSLEDEQDALLREEQCASILRATRRYINEISTINREGDGRVIFRIHDEIWRAIFLEVVSDIDDPPNDSFPAVAISHVSYSWRTKALAYPALWRNIYMKASGFSSGDATRIVHYRQRSKDKLLHITLQIGGSTSDESLSLLVGSVTDMVAVNSMLITGNSRWKTKVSCTSIPWSVLKAIRRLRKLEIRYVSESHSPNHQLPSHIVKGLDELVLQNCTLKLFTTPIRTQEMGRLVRLSIVRIGSSALRWDLFHDWIMNSAATLEDLRLSTEFSQDQLPNNNQPAIFSRLASIRTSIKNLLLIFNWGICTPALRDLTISRHETFDVDAWKTYATDPQGGGKVTDVSILGVICANDVESYSTCLRSLPGLEYLDLYDKNIEPLLKALIPREPTNGQAKPLENLDTLTVLDYDGDGADIPLFAVQYQSESNLADPPSDGPGCSLNVRLQNCPNISSRVLRQLREIGSMD